MGAIKIISWEGKRQGGQWLSTYRVWDVANGMDPDFPRYGKSIDSVNGDSVLVLQQVNTVDCHLQAKAAHCDCPHNSG